MTEGFEEYYYGTLSECKKDLSAKAFLAAEQRDCLDFWVKRGILDRSYYRGEERYLFLHLNIGEYLAGKHISLMEETERKGWVLSHYRQSRWHETIRMAIACEGNSSIAEWLLEIEKNSCLPDGGIFLAVEGLGESRFPEAPQALYDRLLAYIQGDNPYLAAG